MIRTICPDNYIPPTREEIDAECADKKVKQSAPDFVRDICTIMAGGRTKNHAELIQGVEQDVKKLGFPQRFSSGNKTSYFSKTGNQGATPQQVIDADNAKYMKFHRQVLGMIEKTQDMMKDVPGGTPFEKSINLLKLIQAQQPPPPPKGGGGGGGGGGGEQSTDDEMNALGDMSDTDALKKKIENVLDTVNSLDDQELNMMSGTDDDDKDSNNPARLQDAKAMRKMKVAEKMDAGDSIIMEVARHLKEFSKLKSKIEIKFHKDLEGETVTYRPMENLGEIGRLRQSDWSMYAQAPSLFKYKALTGSLRVRERGNFTHYKQLLYMIIDCSGSMGGERYYKAGGVLMNRLKAVVKGEAELIWRLFDDRAYEEHYAKTVEDAYASLDFMRNKGNFNGGGTNFDVALQAAARSINANVEQHGYIKPEIMIVTDGDGRTNFKKNDLKGCVVHAVCVCQARNSSLLRLTQETGGIYTHC